MSERLTVRLRRTPLPACRSWAGSGGEAFKPKLTEEVEAASFLATYGVKLDLLALRPRTEMDIACFLRRIKHSAPGPNGVPYAAWRAAGGSGTRVLYRVMCEIMEGKGKPFGFNFSISAFPEKGEQEGDSREEVTRDPADTRPLSLKTCDNKTLAAVVNDGMTWPISKWAEKSQRGFVKGRQGLQVDAE